MINSQNRILNKLNQKIIEPIFHQIYREKILNHRLFFCINSGRSGSKYLAELINTSEEVLSYHEPVPSMNGFYLNLINEKKYAETFSQRRYKSHAIKNILLKLPEEKIYCETNHMFIKTFSDVIVNDFKKTEVIILRRQLARVLKSFIELGYFSEKNNNWTFWMSSPNAVTSAIQCIDSDENMDQYDLCIAYLIDIEARALRFKQQYPNVKVHEIRLEALQNFDNVKILFNELNIKLTKATENMASQKINERQQRKKRYTQGINIDLSFCQERINRYIEKAKTLNILIPSTLALDDYYE